MATKFYIGKSAQNLSTAGAFEPYVGVIITAGTYIDANNATQVRTYEAGDTSGASGRVLELDCAWGTQAMANNILNAVNGYSYQPYTADNAMLEPVAEIGDAVAVNGVVGGISKVGLDYGRMMLCNVSAPHDEEVEHEYTYQSPTAKAKASANRELMEVRASIISTIDGLEAEVVKQEGGSSSTFGWYLKSDKFELKSNGNTVFKCDSSGITVNGNGSFSGDVTCTNLTVGNTTFTGAVAESLLNLLDDNNGNWSSAYTSTSSGGYCYGGANGFYNNSSFKSGAVRNWTGAIQSPYSPTFEGNTGTWKSGAAYGIPYYIFCS